MTDKADPHDNFFKYLSMNSLYYTLKELQFDVITLSDILLNDNDSDRVNIDGYKTFTCSRINTNGGGVALYMSR